MSATPDPVDLLRSHPTPATPNPSRLKRWLSRLGELHLPLGWTLILIELWLISGHASAPVPPAYPPGQHHEERPAIILVTSHTAIDPSMDIAVRSKRPSNAGGLPC